MSGDGEFDVDWANDVDSQNLFGDDSVKEDTNMVSEDEAEVATHPSTQGTTNQSRESSEHSSVEEGERKDQRSDKPFKSDTWEDDAPSRPSWVTNDSSDQSIPKDSRPPPYTPSPDNIAKEDSKTLSPGTSRLATFSGDLKLRFNDNSQGSDASDGPENKEEDDDFPQEEPWPEDVANTNNHVNDSSDEEDEDAKKEAQGGDAFAAEAKISGEDPPETGLNRNLSNNWMEFDDEKWDASKHSQAQPVPDKLAAKSTSFAEEVVKQQALNAKKKKNGKQGFSLEAGLAKVTKKTKTTSTAPESEQKGGVDAAEVISFWGEGLQDEEDEEEEDANDPLSMALKAKQTEQPQDRSDERNLYDAPSSKTPKSNYSQLAVSSPSGKNNTNQQQPAGSGWLQKGIGSAMNLVTNLPFTKPKDTDEPITDDNVEEVVEEEVDDMPYPNYTNLGTGAAPPIERQPRHNSSMADVSAMSDDSAYFMEKNRRLTGEMSKSDREDAIIRASAAAIIQQNEDYDPLKAAVERMNDQSETPENTRGIKFSKETKNAKLSFRINPIFDLFIDLPHPTADSDSPHDQAIFIGAPTEVEEEKEIQQKIRDNMQDISCLTFPDYDSSVAQEEQEEGATPIHGKTSLETPGFQHYTFTLKLESGSMVYAHVRRYLPPHKKVVFRYDVGRRLGRAMIMFTRFPGGDDLFATVLKTLDAIGSQHYAMKHSNISRPKKWFLQSLYQKHYRLSSQYATNFEDRRGGPHILTIQGLEFPDCMEYYAMVDTTHLFMPNTLLHEPVLPHMKTSFSCSVLPVLRALGVVNTLRLLSALLSERRVILVSISATRLDRSVRAAITMLSHGLLNWCHTSIPVLPPDLWSVLKTPSPYIVGVLAPLAYRLELTDRLGDVVVFNLDENTVVSMGDQKLNKIVPDLCRSLTEDMLKKRRIALPENVATEKDMTALSILNSTADFLAQDLVEIVKADKQTMYGTSVKAKHVAKKAKKVVKSTLNYFWGGGKKEEEDGDVEVAEKSKTKKEKKMEADAVFIEGCRNEAGEEAARLAFVSFFLRMLGNHEGYVYSTEDSDFSFDKERFLMERKNRGDGGNSPMWNMLLNFCETQMAEDWSRMREEHIRGRQPIPADAPLFWQCVDFLEKKDIDFGILNVRSVARMMLQKTSVQQMLPSNVRRLTMALTSKRKFEGNLDDAMSDLAELSRESASALYDVTSVVWLRTRDCKGLQWVHGYQAVRVLREVLLHGPLAAVAEVTDGIEKVRTLAFRRSQGHEQIGEVAMDIYNLLADRSRLFLRRRVAAEQRRKVRDPEETPLLRDSRLNLSAPFKEIHAAMNPALRPQEPARSKATLSSRRASLSSRLPHRLSITKHIMALEPLEDDNSINSFSNMLNIQAKAGRQNDFLHDTLHRPDSSQAGSLGGDLATARRYVREISRKTKETEKERTKEYVHRRDSNAMGLELLKKQFMLLKVAIYISPIFYIFGNHEHFLAIVMFLWLSQQLQVFKAPIDRGAY